MATEIEQLTAAVEELTKQIRRGGNAPTGSSSSSWNPIGLASGGLNKFADATETAGNALGKLASGSATAKDALQMFTGALKDYGGAFGKILANVGGKFTEAMITTNDNLNKSAEFGANFNNNIAEFDYLIKGARMTQEEYTEMVKKGAQELSGMGSSVNSAQKNFLKMAEAYQSSPVITQLEKLGMSAEEANKALYVSSQGRGGVNGNDPNYQRMQIEAAERLILAVDENTRITGIGRKEALEELQKKKDDRKLKLARSFMSQEQITALDQALAKMQGMGPAFKRVFEEVMTGGIRTLEGRQSVAAIGPAAPDVIKAANLFNKGDIAAGEAMLQRAMAHAMQVQQDPNMRKAAMYGGSDVTEKMAEEYARAESYRNRVLSKQAEQGKEGTRSVQDFESALGDVISDAQRDQRLGQEGGPPLEGAAKAAVTINEINMALKGLAAGLSGEFGKLATEAGNAAGSVKLFGQSLDEILAQRSQKGWEELASKLSDEVKNTILTTLPNKLRDNYQQGKETTNIHGSNEDIVKPVTEKTDGRASGSPTFEKFLNGNGGFKDMFEEFDPKGTPMELHGRELVATEEQMKRFMEKMFPEDMIKQITNHAKTAISQAESNATPTSITMPVPTSFGSQIADQLKPLNAPKATASVETRVSPSNSLERVDEVFKKVADEMTVVTHRLSDVADKLKGINFNVAGEKLSEQIQETFKNLDPQHLFHPEDKRANVDKEDERNKTEEERKAKAEQRRKEEVERNKPIVENAPAADKAVVKEEPKKENISAPLNQPETIEQKEAADKKAKFDAETKDYNGYVGFLKDKLEELKFHHHNAFYDSDKKRYQDELDKMIAQGPPKLEVLTPKPVQPSESTPAIEPKSTTIPAKEEIAKDFPADEPIVEQSEVGLMDARDKFTNAELKELETGELTPETIKRQEREGLMSYFTDKIAELRSRDDEDAKHDLPIIEAEFEKFKPKAAAEAAKQEKERNATLAREKREREKEEAKHPTYESTDEGTVRTPKHEIPVPDKSFFEGHVEPGQPTAKEERKPEPLDTAFNNLSNKLTESIGTPRIKPEDSSAKLASAIETFKSPDYSTEFSKLDNRLSSSELYDEYKKQELEKESGEEPTSASSSVTQTEGPSFFDKIASIFKEDNSPLFTRGNVKYEDVAQETPEENAERMRILNSPEAIAARKADENSELNKEIYRQKHSGLYKNNPDLHENLKKQEPAKEKPAEEKPITKHIGGLETWDEFNARLDAEEVRQSHAQIKDSMKYQLAPSTEELKHKPISSSETISPPPTVDPVPAPSPQPIHQVSLKDIYDLVSQLNKTMTQMAGYTQSIYVNSTKQVKATKGLSDNRWA